MTDQQFEEFAKQWPDLFQKSGDFELSVGYGWYTIINTLFALISSDVERAKSRLKFAMDNPDKKMNQTIEELEAAVEEAIDNLPIIDQVKEKFGTLRFYVSNSSEKLDRYIVFAESMSGVMCEVCGAPGERRSGSWIRTLCDAHSKEADERDTATF